MATGRRGPLVTNEALGTHSPQFFQEEKVQWRDTSQFTIFI